MTERDKHVIGVAIVVAIGLLFASAVGLSGRGRTYNAVNRGKYCRYRAADSRNALGRLG